MRPIVTEVAAAGQPTTCCGLLEAKSGTAKLTLRVAGYGTAPETAPIQAPASDAPAGWYPDPFGHAAQRYWEPPRGRIRRHRDGRERVHLAAFTHDLAASIPQRGDLLSWDASSHSSEFREPRTLGCGMGRT